MWEQPAHRQRARGGPSRRRHGGGFLAASVAVGLFAAQAEQPLLWRLTPPQRTRVLAGLALVIVLGMALLLFAWWAARATRRYLRRQGSTGGTSRAAPADDWAAKPLYDERSDQAAEDRAEN